ncbi:hypothetical protein [Streptococcus merionis]|uniref:Putative DNA-binding protein n=1 Tax=Streptococcus merionis TaxID=400065 RepID=A0A239SX92_9STRE|nr:hypothetical protein [Streptococcus merionis]SNU89448.1 putative DNA-binding protein [Streptococcus merionis]
MVLDRLELHGKFKEIQGTRLGLLNNLVILFLKYKMNSECLTYAKELLKVSLQQKRFDYLAQGLLYQGICQEEKDTIAKALRIMKDTGEEPLYQQAIKTLERKGFDTVKGYGF